MTKHQLIHKPWSYRSNLMLWLLICSLVASLVAFPAIFLYTRSRIRSESAQEQANVAQAAVRLYTVNGLTEEEVRSAAEISGMKIVSAAPTQLTDAELALIDERGWVTLERNRLALPVTWVRLGDTYFTVSEPPNESLTGNVVLRLAASTVIFLTFFSLASMLAARYASRPVEQFAQAMGKIVAGDYTYRLPETDENKEMAQLMAAFNEMAETLERNDSIQKDFIAGVSHEFRTPIAAIKGYARLLEMPGLEEEERAEYLSTITTEANRLQQIAQTLLRLSSLEQKGRGTPLQIAAFRLDEQLRQCIAQLSAQWQPKEIEWELDLREISISSDEALLQQVWTNILQNAIKFSPDGGCIRVALYDAGEAVVSIEDHGIGMDEETRRHIFDRFYQADRSRSREGVGLGLTLTKRILDILCGTIHTASSLGEGSTFTVRIPIDYASRETGGRNG